MAKARGGAQQRLVVRLGSAEPRRYLPGTIALAAFLAGPAWAEKWDVVPTLVVRETYTDNVALAPDASKLSDWITQVIPGISIAATGAQARFKVDYRPEIVHYAQGSADDQVFHRGNAEGKVELAKQLLFIDASARIDQSAISLRGPITTSNIYATDNRATVSTLLVSPYLLHDFGSAMRGEARFIYTALHTDNPSPGLLSDNEGNRVHLRLASGPAYKQFAWEFAYRKESITYDAPQRETLTDVFTATSRLLMTPTLGLLGQAGYESYDSGIPGSLSEGSRWAAGLDWTPTPRSRVAATGGERFFGKTYNFDFRHRTRLTAWSASYIEDITTSRTEFFGPATNITANYLDPLFVPQQSDPEARQKEVQEFSAKAGLPSNLDAPVNFFSDQLFLVKRWLASAALLGVRNVVVANAFQESRDVLFAGAIRPGLGDFAASNSIRQTGGSLAWGWRVSVLTTWNMGAGYSRNEFLDRDRVDNVAYFRVGLARQFQPRLVGSLFVRRQQNDSSQSAFSYTENSATAALQVRF
jgi:uncharacterized protein (PEP-CTERM system associated)